MCARLSSGPGTPAYDIQQACGTGLEAVILVANKIALGQLDVGIAGGVDSASDAPLAVNERMRAALVLLASEEWGAARRLPVLGWFEDAETGAVDFVHGGDGLLMAPVFAVPRLLARNGLALADFDFYEIHEAFASQVLATLKAW